MSSPKISVIVPVYNVEKYLSECLDSIVNQTLKDIEIICLNDGSTDNSFSILKEYALKDERIILIDKENDGLGYTRKIGLDNAKGEYILFCDSDDYYCDLTAFEELYNLIEKLKVDVLIFESIKYNEFRKDLGFYESPADRFNNPPQKEIFSYLDIGLDNMLAFRAYMWKKIYSKKFFDKYNDWYFPKHIIVQDLPLHFQILMRAKMSYINRNYYVYRTRAGSAQNNKNDIKLCNFCQAYKDSYRFLKDKFPNVDLSFFVYYGCFKHWFLDSYQIKSINTVNTLIDLIKTIITSDILFNIKDKEVFCFFRASFRMSPENYWDYLNKKTLKNKNKEIIYRDKIIKNLDNAVKYRDDVIKNLDNAIKYRDDVIKNLDNAVKYGDDAIKNLDNAVKYGDDAIKNLDNAIKYEDNAFKDEYLFEIKKSLDKNKKTILFYYHYWDVYGICRILSIIIPELTQKYNIILVTGAGKGHILPNLVKHIIIDVSNANIIADKLLIIALYLSVDVFCGNVASDYMFNSYKLFRDHGIKTIACNHEHYFRNFEEPIYNYLVPNKSLEFENANVVTWLTNYYNNIYSINNDNGIVMPNPLTFEVQNEKHLQTNRILCIGDFKYSIKRLDLIIEIFAKVLIKKKDVELYLVGNYINDELKYLLDKFNIPNSNIHIVGQIEDVSKFYKLCSIHVMTSETEGWGMVLTEAGSFGVPTVMLKIDGLEDIIVDGKNGFILDRYDLDGAADKILTLISDKELYDNMSCNSLFLAKRFEKDKITARWEKLLEAVVSIEEQKTLNGYLKKEFPTNKINKDILIKRLVTTYEKNFSNSILYYEDKISYRDNVIKNLDNAVKYRDNVVKNLDNAVKDRDNVIKNLDNAVKYRDNVVKNLDNAVKDKDNVIKSLDNAVKYRDNVIKNLDNVVKDRDNNLKNLNNLLSLKEQYIKRLQNSWSYRIGRAFTYPLSIPLEFYKFIRDYNLIKKSNLFDSEYYLANNEDVKNAKVDPIKHYLKFGWKEGKNPSVKFDGNEYLDKRPDVQVADICPLVHYLKFGKYEK